MVESTSDQLALGFQVSLGRRSAYRAMRLCLHLPLGHIVSMRSELLADGPIATPSRLQRPIVSVPVCVRFDK